jgi:uncharacterized protein YPO0396
MYQLEALHAVQYYLIEAQTLHFDRTTGIISPNGAGKSALLDAIQIVLLGGDGNAIRLNAQAGGDADGRSIRQYCLGYYRDTDTGYARPSATTYLTLVFRDTESQLPPLSAGLALGASVDDPRHLVYGMYLLPGVALELADHLEDAAGERLPVDWATFKATAIARCKEAGTKAQFEPRSNAFVKTLLFALRPSSARDVNPEAFRKAFKNAMNLMRVPNTDHFIRHLVAEERPINLEKFREQLDSFRELKRKVEEVIVRISAAELVRGLFMKAATTRMHQATYRALAAEIRRDTHHEKLDAAHTARDGAAKTLAQAERRAQQADRESEHASLLLQGLHEQAKQDPDFGREQAKDEAQAQRLQEGKKQLTKLLQRGVEAFDRGARVDAGAPVWAAIAKPWRTLLDRVRDAAASAPLDLDPSREEKALLDTLPKLEASAAQVATAYRAAVEHQERLEANAKVLGERIRRAADGKATVRDAVLQVRRALEDAGIQATPVCDLVRVRDPAWAAALEGYLRNNIDALLIEPGREDEAIAIYEAIPAGYNVFNVKLVKPARTLDVAGLPSDALAHLVEGSDRAVSFLQARLGRLRQLERASAQSADGLTRTGMLVKDGSVERLMLRSATDLLLGKRDARELRDTLARQRMELDKEVTEALRRARKLAEIHAALQPLANARQLISDITEALSQHAEVESLRAAMEAARQEGESADLISLREAISTAMQQAQERRLAASEAHAARGKAEDSFQQAQRLVQALEEASAPIERAAIDAFQAPHVDAGWAEAKRTELERAVNDGVDALAWCEERAASADKQLGPQLLQAGNEYATYAKAHQITVVFALEDIDGALGFLNSDLQRLRESDLASYQAQADEAFSMATRTFRSRIAAQLNTQFDDLRAQIRTLNSILQRSPAFTNDERYHFKMIVAPEHKPLYTFITTVAERGEEDTMFETPAQIPDEFRDLMEASATSQRTLLEDYRLFFTFDVEVQHQGKRISTLGKRMTSGSGGERRAPLFVVAGAALAAAYGKSEGDSSGLSLILLDELGDKIDDENMNAVFEYLRALGLQPIVAAPGTALGSVSASLDSYIELYRDEDVLEIQHVTLQPGARELLGSDLLSRHPELLAHEVASVLAQRESTP